MFIYVQTHQGKNVISWIWCAGNLRAACTTYNTVWCVTGCISSLALYGGISDQGMA
jgi:uncharacterized membrane protein